MDKAVTKKVTGKFVRAAVVVVSILGGVLFHCAQAQTLSMGSSRAETGVAAMQMAYVQPVSGVLPGSYHIQPVEAGRQYVAVVSQENMMLNYGPIYMSEDEFLDIEAEGKTVSIKLEYDKGLHAGVWRSLFSQQS